jgi:hypothetical protein
MTGVLHDVARAALPVAAALLVVAGAARVVLWMDLDDERLQYVARQYLAPLSAWCLGAVAVYAIALGGAGEAGLAPLAVAAGIGGAAVLLRAPEEATRQQETGRGAEGAGDDRRRPPAAEDSSRAATRPLGEDVARARPAPARAPDTAGSLWREPAEDSTRTGLWSR